MDVITLDSITKTFGNYRAVDGISFNVESGKVFGLLGPNGAGKTTTIRMITNILVPDSGKITISDLHADEDVKNHIGYLPEERGLYKKINVIDQIIYFAELKGVPRKIASEKAHYWLNKMGASGWEKKKIQELSKGMQQKVQFVTTVIHDPRILILDEPFSGFDPINTELLKQIILELKNEGKTIILSTHVMSQVEEMCDDMVLINKGQILLNGNVRQVKKSFGNNNYLIEFDGDNDFNDKLINIGANIFTSTNSRIEFKLENSSITNKELFNMIADKVDIIKFQKSEPSLHEIFIEVVAKQNMKTGVKNEE